MEKRYINANKYSDYTLSYRDLSFSPSMALHSGTLQIFENNVGVSDAVLLDPLTEEKFLENLQQRFRHQQIYVCIYLMVIYSI